MIIDRINQCLTEKGFQNIRVNVNNIYLHYVVTEREIYMVALFYCPEGNEFSAEQYRHIRDQLYDKFQNQNDKKVRLLSIFCTNNVEGVRNYLSDGEQWFIDTVNYRMILYENQNGDFLGLKETLEGILLGYQPGVPEGDSGTAPAYDRYEKQIRKPFRPLYFSKCNTTIVILNVLVFLLVTFSPGLTAVKLIDAGALNWVAVYRYKQYYRLFTYMFLHYGIEHLVNNMLVLLVIGDNLERALGKWKYVLTYFASGVIAGLVSLSYNMMNHTNAVSVGASGAIFGAVGAMAYIVIINKGRLEDLSSWQIILFVFFSLYGGLTSQGIDNAAHVGGLLAGAVIAVILYRKRKRSDAGSAV